MQELKKRTGARLSEKAQVSSVPILLLLGGTFASLLTAGGADQLSLGIFLAIAGGVLLQFRPWARCPRALWIMAGLTVACSALALLPQGWFGMPSWRAALEDAPAIALPGTVSLAPSETAFWILLLGLSLAIGLFALSSPLGRKHLLFVATGAVVLTGLWGTTAIYSAQTGWQYWADTTAAFGFLPNRNHAANFLVVGAILSLGILGLPRSTPAVGFRVVAGIVLLISAISLFFFCGSRAGIILFAVGVVLWLVLCGRAHWSRTRLFVVLGALIYSGVFFFTVSSEAQRRVIDLAERAGQVTDEGASAAVGPVSKKAVVDFRVLVFLDTLKLIRDLPVTGVGLGGFVLAFSHYRDLSAVEAVALHPESDWLMLAAEAGLPALCCAAGLIILLFWKASPARHEREWPLRCAFITAATVAVVHGFFDVPAHRVSLGWWVMLLGAVGCQSAVTRDPNPGIPTRVFFLIAGAAAFLTGSALIRAAVFEGPPLPPFAVPAAEKKIQALFDAGQWEQAAETADAAIAKAPAAGDLYHYLGSILLNFEGTREEVEDLFEAERLLDPFSPSVPLKQGEMWLKAEVPDLVVPAWTEAILRQSRIDLRTGRSGGVGLAQGLFLQAPNLKLRESLLRSVETALAPGRAEKSFSFRTDLLLAYLESASREEWDTLTGSIFKTDPELRGFTPSQRTRFVSLWARLGDRVALREAFARHPDWVGESWRQRAEDFASAGEYEAAYAVLLKNLPPPQLPNLTPIPLQQAERAAALSPNSVVALYRAFLAQRSAGDHSSALRTLRKLSALPTPPAYVRYLSAANHGELGNWKAAWEDLQRYQQSVPEVQ